ncbi:MAG: beta-ketoacyl-[acyl-carrier-protein] synthase family protein [Bacteroidia bacterium]|nr:beta-ketoacyl-[acyl-carrier-protein] synthase family protein [Bacteroidia bacterium]
MKIYVTGLGVITSIGQGVSENLRSLETLQHGMGSVTLFPTELHVPVSEVKLTDGELKRQLGLPPERTYTRTALLGLVAAQEAVTDAQVDCSSPRVGLISSTSVGGMNRSEEFYKAFRSNSQGGRLREVVGHDCGASTECMAAYLGIKGFTTTVSTACSSGANALILGARLIKHGCLDTVIVGGTDALCRFTMNGFNSLMILDKAHCRPFDESRSGLNLGEGAGYLVLQSEHAMKRTPYAELTGYANINEAYHQTGSSPEGDGPYMAMSQALASAGISPSAVDYINVHGTGTPNNDASEGKAIQRLFADSVPAFSSVKAFIGHTLGASEGIEAVYSVVALQQGLRLPNLNFQTPIAGLGLAPETLFRRGVPTNHVLSNSFGFGGSNSSLLFSSINV